MNLFRVQLEPSERAFIQSLGPVLDLRACGNILVYNRTTNKCPHLTESFCPEYYVQTPATNHHWPVDKNASSSVLVQSHRFSASAWSLVRGLPLPVSPMRE